MKPHANRMEWSEELTMVTYTLVEKGGYTTFMCDVNLTIQTKLCIASLQTA